MSNGISSGRVRIVPFHPDHYTRLRLRREDAVDLSGDGGMYTYQRLERRQHRAHVSRTGDYLQLCS